METILDAPANIHIIALVTLTVLLGIYWYVMNSPAMKEFRETMVDVKNRLLVHLFVKRDGMILATQEPSWFVSLLEAYGLL
jgi:hypothetical protein